MMVKGRTALIQKDPAKGKAVSNYRPIACLPLMWKLLTGIFAEKIYDHLQENSLLPEEQKGCQKKSRGTKDQLLIDKAVLREARVKKRYLAMSWIDYRKAYDIHTHSWILDSLALVKAWIPRIIWIGTRSESVQDRGNSSNLYFTYELTMKCIS